MDKGRARPIYFSNAGCVGVRIARHIKNHTELKNLGGQRVTILIQRTIESLIIEELGSQRVAILLQRTNESLIIEEYKGPKGSDFDTAHERKLDY